MNVFAKTLIGVALGATLGAGATLATSGTAMAARSIDRPVTVRFGDLNLNSAEGVRRLYVRVESAAMQVCGPRFSVLNASHWREWKECHIATIDDAVRRIDRPVLTAFHQQKGTAKRG